MPARWSPGVALAGTVTVNGTSCWAPGARLSAEIDGVTHAPAFLTGVSRFAYTAPEVWPVSPSTAETSSCSGASLVLVISTSSR